MSGPPKGRGYRLAPRDRTGLAFGLGIEQLLTIATTVVVATVFMMVGLTALGITMVVAGGVVGVGRVRGTSIIDLLPHAFRYLRYRTSKRSQWQASVPLLGGSRSRMPSGFEGLHVAVVNQEAGARRPNRIVVTHDANARLISATVRVVAPPLVLLDADEQDARVTTWGSALQSFIAERPTVRQIRWTEWSAPLGVDEHRRWIAQNRADATAGDSSLDYGDVLGDAHRTTQHHDVLVTIATDGSSTDHVEPLLHELRMFTQRLEGTGHVVSRPLSPDAWIRAMQLRLDPWNTFWLSQQALSAVASQLTFEQALPASTRSEWTTWRAGSTLHRCLQVVEWPRTDVPAAWLGELLRFQSTVRSVTVGFEPVPKSRSYRGIVREAAKIESDAEHRAQRGFRVGAAHRRAAQAVEERESELVAGYGEVTYAGLIGLAAPSLAQLDDATGEITQLAASLGMELQPLHGRHELAVCATLPIARGPALRSRP